MSKLTEFKRMNFFTGFFTTAKDWNDGQDYHQRKRRLHNQGLHTPGIVRNIGDEQPLQVVKESTDDSTVTVRPGVAIDGNGNEICLASDVSLVIDLSTNLPRTDYIAILYNEVLSDKVENIENPEYNGYTRYTETPIVRVMTDVPDNKTAMELARIRLSASATTIDNAHDPAHPVEDEIDLTHALSAGAAIETGSLPSPEEISDVVQRMVDSRADFAALGARFPVPPIDDVRQSLLMVEMLMRSRALHLENVSSVLTAVARLERAVEQDLAEAYPAMIEVPITAYTNYQNAVQDFMDGLGSGATALELFTLQSSVSEAARLLSEIVLQAPVADAGAPESIGVTSTASEAKVTLDAGGTQVFGNRQIVAYRWQHRQG